MENSTFRSVTFGGFSKEDVIRYIEETAQTATSVQENLQKENAALQDANLVLSEQLAALQSKMDAQSANLEQLRVNLERESSQRQALEPCKVDAVRLAQQVEALRPDAEAYAQFRQRIGAIECEARKRAADMEASTFARLEQVLTTFRNQYLELMTTFDATATHVTGELRKVEVNLAQLPRAMDQTGAELSELSSILDCAAHKESEK